MKTEPDGNYHLSQRQFENQFKGFESIEVTDPDNGLTYTIVGKPEEDVQVFVCTDVLRHTGWQVEYHYLSDYLKDDYVEYLTDVFFEKYYDLIRIP